jgi:hypothetical protein
MQQRRKFVRSQAFGDQIGDYPADKRMPQDRVRRSKICANVRPQTALVGGAKPHDLDAAYRFARELEFRRPASVDRRLAVTRPGCDALQAYRRIAGLCPFLEQGPEQRRRQFRADDRGTAWLPSSCAVDTRSCPGPRSLCGEWAARSSSSFRSPRTASGLRRSCRQDVFEILECGGGGGERLGSRSIRDRLAHRVRGDPDRFVLS